MTYEEVKNIFGIEGKLFLMGMERKALLTILSCMSGQGKKLNPWHK
jgi:hypothetical protein